jgi:hypothetical protein
LKVLEEVAKTIRRNQKNPKKQRIFTTWRLRHAATELLITNRYVEEDSEFFKVMEDCWDMITMTNDQLGLWEHTPETTEPWLLGDSEESRKLVKICAEKVAAARQKLSGLV